MSAIALAWVAKIKVGNQTAKQLIHFYAAHGFSEYNFKISTIADQLECSERAIQKAHKLLIEKEFIIKEERFDKSGRQLTSKFKLNIPSTFVDNFFNSGGRVNDVRGEGERCSSLGVNDVHPLNSNINNKKNKGVFAQKEHKPVDKSPQTKYVGRSTVSDEYKKAKKGNKDTAKHYLDKIMKRMNINTNDKDNRSTWNIRRPGGQNGKTSIAEVQDIRPSLT